MLACRWSRRRLLRWPARQVEIDEPIAGRDERLGRAALAESVHRHPRLAKSCRQPREVAVARNDREALHVACIEQVHGVDDQRRVGGVLATRVGELLNRLDRMAEQMLLPADEVRCRPVAVRPLDGGRSVLGDLLEQLGGQAGGRVVGVDQYGESHGVGAGHECIVPQRRPAWVRSAGAHERDHDAACPSRVPVPRAARPRTLASWTSTPRSPAVGPLPSVAVFAAPSRRSPPPTGRVLGRHAAQVRREHAPGIAASRIS